MTINQRLKEYFESKKIDAPEFYKKIGIDRIEWSGWINSAKPISLLKLQRIVNTFPDLNARWLLTGEGDMLVFEPVGAKVAAERSAGNEVGNEILELYKKMLADKDNEINFLRNQLIGSNKIEVDGGKKGMAM